MKEKKYTKIIIVNEDNHWAATGSRCTLKEAVQQFKDGEIGHGYDESEAIEYYAFGVDKETDELYFN